MKEINLFTPITFGNQPRSINENRIEFYDSYFNVIGWSARVISKNELEKSYDVEWHYEAPNYLISALKVISYVTVLLPLIVLVIKQNLKEGLVFKFKEIDSEPKSPQFNLDGEHQEIKIKHAVDTLLKQGKVDSARQLLEGRDAPYIEEIKAQISIEESKKAIVSAIKGADLEKIKEILSRYSADEKDELIETWILESSDAPFEISQEISNQYKRLLLQKKMLESQILRDLYFEGYLEKMETSDEKDSVIKLAIKSLMENPSNYQTVVQILNRNSFKNAKTAVLVLEQVSEKLLGSRYVQDFLEILEKPLLNKDPLLLKAMDILLEASKLDWAKDLLQFKCQSVFIKGSLYLKYALFLPVDSAVELMKSISKEHYAKEAVKSFIKDIVKKDHFNEAAELIRSEELYSLEYAEAFMEAASPDRQKNDFVDPLYEVAQILKKNNCNEQANRIYPS